MTHAYRSCECPYCVVSSGAPPPAPPTVAYLIAPPSGAAPPLVAPLRPSSDVGLKVFVSLLVAGMLVALLRIGSAIITLEHQIGFAGVHSAAAERVARAVWSRQVAPQRAVPVFAQPTVQAQPPAPPSTPPPVNAVAPAASQRLLSAVAPGEHSPERLLTIARGMAALGANVTVLTTVVSAREVGRELDVVTMYTPHEIGTMFRATTDALVMLQVPSASLFAAVGLRPGDRIVAIDGYDTLADAIVTPYSSSHDQLFVVEVQRGARTVVLGVTVRLEPGSIPTRATPAPSVARPATPVRNAAVRTPRPGSVRSHG